LVYPLGLLQLGLATAVLVIQQLGLATAVLVVKLGITTAQLSFCSDCPSI